MKSFLCKLLLIVYIFPSVAFAQSSLESQIKRVELGLLPPVLIKGDPAWSIAERMKFYKVPGLSVAVIKDFRVEWARAYGVKDVETNAPVTVDTLFQAGSISKSVNATVAMKKVEQGKISLDENINNKLTSWKLPDNDFTAKKKVTLRNLLSHTAGTTVHGFPGYAVSEKVPSLPQVLDGTAPANTAAVRVDFEPGTRFRYSGGGTTIAQLAIMDIEKKPYPEIAKETVLGPLNMTRSTIVSRYQMTGASRLPPAIAEMGAKSRARFTSIRKWPLRVCGPRRRTWRSLPLKYNSRSRDALTRSCPKSQSRR